VTPSAAAVSVIIPTRGKPERLVLALHSLVRQASGTLARFETVVVADGHDSGAAEAIRGMGNLPLEIELVESARIGQAAARNLGAARASGEILVFMDDDVLLSPDYLRTVAAICIARSDTVVRAPVYLLRYLAAFRDPETGVPYQGHPTGLVDSKLAHERISRRMILSDWPAIARRCRHLNRFERLVAQVLREPAPRFPWLGYSGSGVGIARRLFMQAGGYDEAFGLMWGAEAIELGYRLWRSGAGFVQAEEIYSAHMDHPRGDSINTFGKSFDLFYAKHGDPAIREVQSLIVARDRRPTVSVPG